MPRDNLPDLVKQAAIDAIRGLAMEPDSTGFSIAGRVYGQIEPEGSNVTTPYWVVSSEGEQEQPLGGDSEWRYSLYPFRAYLMDRRGTKDHAKDAQYRSWRKEVVDHFHERRPITDRVPACYWCEVVPRVAYDQNSKRFQHVQGALLLKFWIREPRHPETLAADGAAGLRAAQGAG